MGIVHYALIMGILACSSSNNVTSYSQVYVYGDDIVIPSHNFELVCTYLARFGMILNTEKSYSESYFRESCGCHAYKGFDVTPAFFQKVNLHTSSPADSTLLLSLLSKYDILRKKKFYSTAAYLRQSIITTFGNLPDVHYDSPMLGFPSERRALMKDLRPFIYGVRRHKEDPQQVLYKVRHVRPREVSHDPVHEHDAYLRRILEGSQGSVSQRQLWLNSVYSHYGCVSSQDYMSGETGDAMKMGSMRDSNHVWLGT
jgi:hypothetical protein